MVKDRAYELRKKDEPALLKQLEEQKAELAQHRVAKVSGGAAAKIHKIRTFRKTIARILTVLHEKKRAAKKEEFKDAKYKPLDLRPKLTRKLRRQLNKKERSKLTLRDLKRKLNFKEKVFSVAN